MTRLFSNPEGKLVRFRNRWLRLALALALIFATPAFAQSQTPDAQGVAATDGPGGAGDAGKRGGFTGLPGGAEGIRTDGHRGRSEISSYASLRQSMRAQ